MNAFLTLKLMCCHGQRHKAPIGMSANMLIHAESLGFLCFAVVYQEHSMWLNTNRCHELAMPLCSTRPIFELRYSTVCNKEHPDVSAPILLTSLTCSATSCVASSGLSGPAKGEIITSPSRRWTMNILSAAELNRHIYVHVKSHLYSLRAL